MFRAGNRGDAGRPHRVPGVDVCPKLQGIPALLDVAEENP